MTIDDRAVADNLARHLDTLAIQIGSRSIYQSEKLKIAEGYVHDEFMNMGLKVVRQEYEAFGAVTANLIAHGESFDPGSPALVVGAHYDTVPGTPGADDNASGVAVLLEAARRTMKEHPDRLKNTLFVAFSTEEPPAFGTPFMGSRVFADGLAGLGYQVEGALVLEMVGYFDHRPGTQHVPPGIELDGIPDAGNFLAMAADGQSAKLAERVMAGYNASGARVPALPLIFPKPDWRVSQLIRLSDNASFWDAGIPALMITDTSFLRNPNYHKRSDTPDKLSVPAMEQVVVGLVGAIAGF
jgi:Zn-dependent M28 family amino/carboxypeptidase